jgi:hypothetical protein
MAVIFCLSQAQAPLVRVVPYNLLLVLGQAWAVTFRWLQVTALARSFSQAGPQLTALSAVP